MVITATVFVDKLNGKPNIKFVRIVGENNSLFFSGFPIVQRYRNAYEHRFKGIKIVFLILFQTVTDI